MGGVRMITNTRNFTRTKAMKRVIDRRPTTHDPRRPVLVRVARMGHHKRAEKRVSKHQFEACDICHLCI
eukprot:scaffold140285_cov38-Prasinocladus_malaysianus.AAC.1